MNKRFVDLVCLTTLFVALGVTLGNAEDKADKKNDAKNDAPALWVTSIAPLSGDTYVAATADGLLLREAQVKTFSVADPTTLTDLYSHPAAVWCVDATADGKTIASVDYRGNLVIYDVESNEAKTHEKALERWCQSLTFAPDDKTIVAGNEAGKVMVWDLAENKVTKTLELGGQAVTALAFSADGKQIAAADGGGEVHLIQWPELTASGKIKVSDQPAWSVVYAGSNLLIGSGDRNLYQCEAKADAKPTRLTRAGDWITEFVVSKNGKLAAADLGGKLYFPMQNEKNDVGSDVSPAKSGAWALCFHDDKTLMVGTRKDGIVVVKESDSWNKPLPPVVDKKPEEEVKAEEEAKPEEKKEMAKEEKKAEKPKAEKKAEEKKPADKKPAAKKAEDKKPADKKPEVKKDDKPEAKKPEAKKPEAEKPEEKKPEESKPAEKK
ncbi:hypothetical protein [Novipirellula rosea]|uniref:WD domain, G-beta repeat n=1 Tax=Novipirellula rosea TaxID=1031540 RepID=A0ABP8MFN9_9BACT